MQDNTQVSKRVQNYDNYFTATLLRQSTHLNVVLCDGLSYFLFSCEFVSFQLLPYSCITSPFIGCYLRPWLCTCVRCNKRCGRFSQTIDLESLMSLKRQSQSVWSSDRLAEKSYVRVVDVRSVISLPFYALFTGSGSLNASNTSSSHLPTKFWQLPNRHTFISSSLFNVLAVLALHPSLLLLGHLHHPAWTVSFELLDFVFIFLFFSFLCRALD